MSLQVFDVLIVGCGNIAGGYDAGPSTGLPLTHAGAFQVHSGFRIAGCVDPDEDKLLAFSDKWDIQHKFKSLDEVVEASVSFDVICICTPTALHNQNIKSAIKLKPRVIFCEKPLSNDLDGACEIVEFCHTENILLAVNHTRRWAPDILALQEEIALGKWGKIQSVSCFYSKGILNNGSHIIDLLQMLLGSLDVLFAWKPHGSDEHDDPTLAAMLLSPDGVSITLNVADAADYAMFEMRLVTQFGVVDMELSGLKWRIRYPQSSSIFPGYYTLGRETTYEGRYKEAMVGAVNNIYHALTGGSQLASDGRSALAAQKICMKIVDIANAY